MLIKHARELEEERQRKRALQSEVDKTVYRIKNLEDDLQKHILNNEKKTQDIN